MKRLLLDTNVLVSFLTDRDEQQQARAAELFAAAADGEVELIVHQCVVTESVYVLRNLYGLKDQEIAAIIRDLLRAPGTLASNDLNWGFVLALWPETIASFGDALLTAVAKHQKPDAVATFDTKLSRQLRQLGIGAYWR